MQRQRTRQSAVRGSRAEGGTMPVNSGFRRHAKPRLRKSTYSLTLRMAFRIDYFHERVLAEIELWTVDVLATPDRELKQARERLKELQDG